MTTPNREHADRGGEGEPAQESSEAVSGHGETAVSHAEPPEWLGRVVDDRYRVSALLGQGGMGAVYVAEHLTLHKEVALKVVREELAGNGEVATRFAREAMATAQFEHPHVASAIDYGTLPEGGAYFVMQLVRGKSLRSLLAQQGRLPWRKACELLAQVADALSAARAAEIIHRDLKPDNILVEPREDGSELAKVLDFGIAHVAPRDQPAPEGAQAHRSLTRVGTVMGTPGYMSPEQAVGDKVDHRTDLYALGVVLWECIVGQELWEGPDLTTVVTRQLGEPVPRLRERVDDPTIPSALEDLTQSLTAKRAKDRPERAGEVRDALRRLAVSESSDISVRKSVELARDWAKGASSRFSALPKQEQQKRLLFGGGGAAIALILLTTLFGSDGDADEGGTTADAEQASLGAAGDSAEPAPLDQLDKVVIAATKIVEPAIDAVTDTGIPDELQEDVDTMLESNRLRDRRKAAQRILEYEPESRVAPHLLVIAEFETARTCASRKDAIDKMESTPHEDFARPLRRLSSARRTGCGFLKLQDCYRCVRADLRRALRTVEKSTGKASAER